MEWSRREGEGRGGSEGVLFVREKEERRNRKGK